MRRIMLSIGALLMCIPLASAQSVEGNITDNKLRPLEGATIQGLNAKDSTFVAGTICKQQGYFILQLPRNGHYLLKVSAVGYKSRYINFSIHDKETAELKKVNLTEDIYQLSGITITAAKAPVEMKAGKTVYNLCSTVSGSQGNVYDVLKQMPGVLFQSDGTILLDGQAGIHVLMNGKSTYLTGETLINYLRSIPASTVEKIELINNPSSHFDAAGKTGLINIETKKVSIKGLAAGSDAGYSQTSTYGAGYGSFYLNLRKDKFNFHTNYTYYQGTDLNKTFMFREYINLNTHRLQDYHMEQDANRTYAYQSHNIRVAADYDFTSRISFSAYFNGNWLNRIGKERMSAGFYSFQEQPDSTSVTPNRLQVHTHNLTGGINTIYLNPDRLKWDASFDLQVFGNTDRQDQENTFFLRDAMEAYRNNILRGDMNGDIRIYCGQTNLVYYLSKRSKLSAGGKTTFVSIDNNAIYHRKENDTWQEILPLNNHFIYDENINAGYITLNAKTGKSWEMEAGIRVENTRIRGVLAGNDLRPDSVFSNHDTHIFPFLQMQYRWKEMHQLTFLYNKRIVRPQYRDLNPFITINDNYLYDQGNTQLKPELAHNMDLSYILRSHYRMSLLASFTRHPITKSFMAQENKRILVMPMNLSSDYSAGMRLSAANLKPVAWWQINANLLLIYRKYAWQTDSEEYRNKRLTPMAYIGNQLHLPKGWTAEANAYWNGKTPRGQAILSPMWSLSAGISKNIFKKQGTISLFAENLLSSRHMHIDVASTTQQGWYAENMYPKVGISLSFRLHRGKKPKEIGPNNSISESKRINL